MRILPVMYLVLSVCVAANADEKRVKEALENTDTVVWCGIDYSQMKMIGSSDSMRVPDLLLQNMPARWNELFLDERIEGVADSLRSRILLDMKAVSNLNVELSRNHIVFEQADRDTVEETHLSEEAIASHVGRYTLEEKDGIALVLLVDRFVYAEYSNHAKRLSRGVHVPKSKEYGAAYVVFFDISTREVLSVEREVHDVSTGGSFRNFWFGPIKNIDEGLRRYRP